MREASFRKCLSHEQERELQLTGWKGQVTQMEGVQSSEVSPCCRLRVQVLHVPLLQNESASTFERDHC